MLIIITGCDATGKSTLAKKLAKIYNAPTMHFSKPPEKAVSYFYAAIKAARDNDTNVIADRWAEGDEPYAITCGHQVMLSEEDKHFLLKEAKEVGLLYIYLYDDPDAIRERMEKRGEDFLRPDQVEQVMELLEEEVDRYRKYFGVPVIKFNPFKDSEKILLC